MIGIYEIKISGATVPIRAVGANRSGALENAYNHFLIGDGLDPKPRLRDVRLVRREPDYQDFANRFTPLPNPLDSNAALDGAWLETFGAEYDFVVASETTRVWTIVEDDEFLWVTAGRRCVNRLGYILTTERWVKLTETFLLY